MRILKTKRQSHCSVCGKRLSTQEPSGEIQWRASKVDDKGIYCNDCYKPKEKSKPPKKTTPVKD